MDAIKNTWKNNPLVIILSVVLVLLIIFVIGLLIIRSIAGRDDGSSAIAVTETAAAAAVVVSPTTDDTEPDSDATPQKEDSTATATKAPPSPTPTESPTDTPAPTATKKPTNTPNPPTATPTEAVASPPQMINVVQNGGFEWGFEDDGVGKGWAGFDNGSAKFIFGPEGWDLALQSGYEAQRITVYQAHMPNRFAGIYQTVSVQPGYPYTLKMKGQIRSEYGDIMASNYGYRVQYALDYTGGDDWQAIADEDWVELPWDEVMIDSPDAIFSKYETEIIPENAQMTLFIRTWGKWADPLEAQYTLDDISLVGPEGAAMALVDQPLPDTGGQTAMSGFALDPIVWISLSIVTFLVGGAAWRIHYRRNLLS